MLERLTPEIEAMADKYIHLANDQAKTAVPKHVSAALSLAAANYAVYVSAMVSTDKADFVARRDQHLEFFTDEFRRMFLSYYRNYTESYEHLRDRK